MLIVTHRLGGPTDIAADHPNQREYFLHNSISSSVAGRCKSIMTISSIRPIVDACRCRPDDKIARKFNITAGAALYLVLELRGGRW
jgi:hypothetical protein